MAPFQGAHIGSNPISSAKFQQPKKVASVESNRKRFHKFSDLNRVVDLLFPLNLSALFGGIMSQSESSRRHYLKNRVNRIADKNARKERNRVLVQEYKRSHSCIACGESEPCCLDFHHRDPTQKDFVIGASYTRSIGIGRIKAEIAKCDILCANCHRKFHYGVLAHLGERRICNAEAVGAEPTSSTIFKEIT